MLDNVEINLYSMLKYSNFRMFVVMHILYRFIHLTYVLRVDKAGVQRTVFLENQL